MKIIYHANSNKKRTRVTKLTTDKTHIKIKMIARYLFIIGHFIIIKGLINQEYVIIINTYVLNNRTLKYMKQKTHKTDQRNRHIRRMV